MPCPMCNSDGNLESRIRLLIAEYEQKSRSVSPGKRDCWKEVAMALRRALAGGKK